MDAKQFLRAMARLPVTSVVLILGFVGYAWVKLGISYLPWVYIPLEFVAETGQAWRLITPVFLHFGVLHIVFNSLWIWELGRRIEIYVGSWLYALIFLLLSFASNWAQFFASKSSNFGGLSGVVYGCLGFLLVARFAVRHPVLTIPDGLYVFMLVFMALGFTGVLDVLVGGSIGNAAHLGGFLMGLFLGMLFFGVRLAQQRNE